MAPMTRLARWLLAPDADVRAVAALYRAARRDRAIRAEVAGQLAESLAGLPVGTVGRVPVITYGSQP
ncbi:MAG: hypothetical protein AB7F22_10455 [Reyranella sp.]|uniref:hypothetical protein n=1 Tax=Reyranella sp. TaxID=1929291 RepID=UPI003D0DD8DD